MTSFEQYLASLIECPSVTPKDAGCQSLIASFLEQLGFQCQWLNDGPVTNLLARLGTEKPLFLFAGHTDVVAVGEASSWHCEPFKLTNQQGMLFGRGVADMKGSIVAMLFATARFLEHHPQFKGSLGFLITSGEEGDDFAHGTPHVMKYLQQQNQLPQYCIVGEPSSQTCTGDMLKIGRRGSLSAAITIHGKQGHVAYPHLAQNPIHEAMQALTELTQTQWDEGNTHFPPTSLQITRIEAGGDAGNIIPGILKLNFNIRFSTEQTSERLIQHIETLFNRHHLKTDIQWKKNGDPFLTSTGTLLETCIKAIQQDLNRTPELSTSGGTSDARFIAPYGVEVIELGPSNATIHQVNECISLESLMELERVYYRILEQLLA